MQSTTSTANCGLYDHLLPMFEDETGIQVDVVAVGTGQAIQNARNGDGDVLLVRAQEREEQFVADGLGVERFDLMYNDFVIVGPDPDPAGISRMSDADEAIAEAQARRSLRAGTIPAPTPRSFRCGRAPASIRPRRRAAGTARPAPAWARRSTPPWAWRPTPRPTGRPGSALRTRGALRSRVARVSSASMARILVNLEESSVNAEAGQTFIDCLSQEGQAAIGDDRVDRQQLFFPNAEG